MTVELLSSSQTTTTTPYLNAFLTERPKDGVDLVQNRLRKGMKLNDELAEYFKERAQAEDAYAKALIKISKKYYVSDKSALGTMLPLWEMLHKELTEIYTIHAVMSLKIMEDVEQPLRESIQGNPEYNIIKSMDANLQRISRDYDERLTRLNKHKSKSRKTSETDAKITEATKSLDESKALWFQVGPEYIQKHQTVDEHRLNTLRTTIQNFEVLQNDQLLKRVEIANNVLTAASAFDITEEISAFALSNAKAASVPPPLSMQDSVSHSGHSNISIDTSPSEALAVPSANSEPVPAPSLSEQSYRSTGAQSTGGKSASGKKTGKERKFLSGLVPIRLKSKSGGNNGYMNADVVPPTMEHSDQHSISSFGMFENNSTFSNGLGSEREDPHDASCVDDAHSLTPASPTSVGSPPSIRGPPSITGSVATTSQPVLVDNEGYTIPPADRAAWPTETVTSTTLLDDDLGSDNGSLFGNQRLKVDIKTETVADADAAQSRVALTRISSMLKERSTAPTGKRRGRRENRMTRLLDPVVESKMGMTLTEVPVPEETEEPAISTEQGLVVQHESIIPIAVSEEQQSTIPVIITDTTVEGATILSALDDNITQESLVSATPSMDDSVFGDQLQSPFDDLSSSTHLQDIPVAAPILTPQIKVYITETIHGLLRGGEVVQSAVIGDVTITYNGPADITRPVYFRVSGIETLDRVVPNPSYLSPVDGDPSVFRLDTNMYHFAGDSPVPSLKYHVKDDKTHKVMPIWVKPMWKCDEDQTRLLVKYRKTEHQGDIHGVFFSTTVSGNVQHVQSIPAGQWMVEQERMVWPMGEWQGEDELLLRAKFTTTQQGVPQPLAVRFEGKGWVVSGVSVVNNDPSMLLQREDGGIWADVKVVEKAIRTGKYIAEA